jgi:hypothetical protein
MALHRSVSDQSDKKLSSGNDSATSMYLDWIKLNFSVNWGVKSDQLPQSKAALDFDSLTTPPVIAKSDFTDIIKSLLNKNKLKLDFNLIEQQLDQFWIYSLTLKTFHAHSGKEEVVGYREIEIATHNIQEEVNNRDNIAFVFALFGTFPDLDNLIACHQIRILIGLDKGYKPILYSDSDSTFNGKNNDSSSSNRSQGKTAQNSGSNQNLNFQKSISASQTNTLDSQTWEPIPEKSINHFFMNRPHLLSEGQIKEVYFNPAVIAKYKLTTEISVLKLGKKLDQFLNHARNSIQSKDFASLFNHFTMIYNSQPTINEVDPSAALVLIGETPILKVVNDCKNKKIRKNLVFLTAVRFLWEDFYKDELK